MFVTAYSDGSSRGNPGPGGYGSVLLYTDPSGKTHTLELSQGYRRTTNNRMELMGAIVALEALKRPCTVELHTDSKYADRPLEPALDPRLDQAWVEDRKQGAGQKRRPAGRGSLPPRSLTT